MLGEPGSGLSVALATLAYGRIGIAAAGVAAQAALDLAVERMRPARVRETPWCDAALQYRLAERATELECARNLYQKAALRVDSGERDAEPEASMAKSFATGPPQTWHVTRSRSTAVRVRPQGVGDR